MLPWPRLSISYNMHWPENRSSTVKLDASTQVHTDQIDIALSWTGPQQKVVHCEDRDRVVSRWVVRMETEVPEPSDS